VLTTKNDNLKLSLQCFVSIVFILLFIVYIFLSIYSNVVLSNDGEFFEKQKILEINKLEIEIDKLNNKIYNLQDLHIDSDLLDEEIRKNFSFARQNETIVYNEEEKNSNLIENNNNNSSYKND
jgi:cell division protein FtsB